MTGLIWFVQIVHYPLFAAVRTTTTSSAFRCYALQHAKRTGWVVFPPMLIELLTSLAILAPRFRPAFLSTEAAAASAILAALIWASTGLLQVPLHDRLSKNPDEATIRSLVRSNWLRTVLWSVRAMLLGASLFHRAGSPGHVF